MKHPLDIFTRTAHSTNLKSQQRRDLGIIFGTHRLQQAGQVRFVELLDPVPVRQLLCLSRVSAAGYKSAVLNFGVSEGTEELPDSLDANIPNRWFAPLT